MIELLERKNIKTFDDLAKINDSFLCGICPDYTVRQPYYNQLFTGSDFPIKILSSFSPVKSGQFYATNLSLLDYTQPILTAKLVAVKEDTPAVVIDNINMIVENIF